MLVNLIEGARFFYLLLLFWENYFGSLLTNPAVQIWQVHWQETLRGYVAGILTTQRVLIVSADLDILAGSSARFDKGLPSISFTTSWCWKFMLPLCNLWFSEYWEYISLFEYPWLLITLDRFYGLGLHFSFLLPLQLVCLVGMGKWGLFSLSVCRMQVCIFCCWSFWCIVIL